ncbi:hypothetical protein M422DRAFT_784804 [Sphaerobolus stellatus SS14]|uniref:Unplaced genomic scaffold SPHSTscaffold_253, whole genome shotgun sequence n=1 Tax=Sphaerobolus stellatus (strain SS14) TaxID=990650 RepID=A0A0C9UF70_SPHS4|nr:hypothetical protein M422DRAFT_784804 [Sphaerobolus stellatus SS14]
MRLLLPSNMSQNEDANTSHIINQPIEILDEILDHMDHGALLALAGTCHRLHEHIVPNHLNFRLIRCSIQRINLWKALQEVLQLQASRIRELEIVIREDRSKGPTTSPVIPFSMIRRIQIVDSFEIYPTKDREETSFAALISAIRNMRSLESFKFNGGTTDGEMASIEELFMAFKTSCRRLKNIQLRWNQWNPQFGMWVEIPKYLGHLNNITSLYFHFYSPLPPNSQLKKFLLTGCPSLQELYFDTLHHLDLVHPYPWILQESNWSCLRRLTLGSYVALWDIYTPNDQKIAIIASFLTKHPLLESLWLLGKGVLHSRGCFPPQAVARLRNLVFSGYLFRIVPGEVAERLHFIRLLTPQDRISERIPRMPNLKSCIMKASDLYTVGTLGRAAPQLEHLHLQWNLQNPSFLDATKCINDIEQNIDQFQYFTSLTLLSGLLCFVDVDLANGHRIIRALMAKLPNLTYVEAATGKERKMVTLERHATGEYKGYHATPLGEIRHDPDFRLSLERDSNALNIQYKYIVSVEMTQ